MSHHRGWEKEGEFDPWRANVSRNVSEECKAVVGLAKESTDAELAAAIPTIASPTLAVIQPTSPVSTATELQHVQISASSECPPVSESRPAIPLAHAPAPPAPSRLYAPISTAAVSCTTLVIAAKTSRKEESKK
jgi:hypothetical protein